MRNEIYNKIRQNKLEYYAELKRKSRELQIKKSEAKENNEAVDSEKKTTESKKKEYSSNVNTPGRDQLREITGSIKGFVQMGYGKLNSVDITQKVRVIYPKIVMTGTAILQFFVITWKGLKTAYKAFIQSRTMKSVAMHIENNKAKLHQVNERINNKIETQTDKITLGIYNVSAGLFEDSDTKVEAEHSVNFEPVVINPDHSSFEWNISTEGQSVEGFYSRVGALSEDVAEWIKDIPAKINRFLASDKLPDLDEMNLTGMK
jgi:hypothetical protein